MGFSCLRQNRLAALGAQPAHRLYLQAHGQEWAGGSHQSHSPNTARASLGPDGWWGEPRAEPPAAFEGWLTPSPINPALAACTALRLGCWPRSCTTGRAEPRHRLRSHQPVGASLDPHQPLPLLLPGCWGAEPQLGSWSSPGWDSFVDLPRCLKPARCPVPRVLVSRCTRRVAAPSWHTAAVACSHARELHCFRASGEELKSSLT